MPKTRKTETELVSADATASVSPAVKKARQPKASSASMHKHAAKQQAKPLTESVASVEPAPEPQALAQPRVVTPEEIAALAYSYWEARGYQGGSAEEDWFRAEHELRTV